VNKVPRTWDTARYSAKVTMIGSQRYPELLSAHHQQQEPRGRGSIGKAPALQAGL
jgi:hypothetical protein